MNPHSSSSLCYRAAIVTIGVGLLALAGCKEATPSARAASASSPAVPVQIALAVKQDLPIVQGAIGTVQALRTVAVKSQVDGVIAEVHFREGEEVKVGDLLLTLDRRPFENSLRSAQAELANARAEADQAATQLTRYQNLDEQAAISKEQYIQYRTKVETTTAIVQGKAAAVANAELQLGYAQIRAPIAGRTGQLSLHEGALVKANDAAQSIVVINQLEPIFVAYSVPESTLTAIRAAVGAGQIVVTASPHATDLAAAEGKLDFIDNSVDPTTGTILLKAVFANANRTLWPGQFVDIVTRIGIENGTILVPTAAVQVGQRGRHLFVVKADHTVELRSVTAGRTAQGKTVIRKGVTEGETVVTDGQLRLVPGSKIEVKPLSEPAPIVAEDGTPLPATTPPKS